MCRKPDLTAPRFRPKALHIMKQETFLKFQEKYPDLGLTYEQFEEIVVRYNGNTWLTAVNERDGVELPESMGNVFIGTCKRARVRRNPDFVKSAELGTVVPHRNWETDNKLAKIFYSSNSSRYRFRGRELWSFKGTREFTRTVAKTFPKKWKQYVVIENMRNIAWLFKKHLRREAAKRIQKNFDYGSYNEFEIS